ncbi:MAG: glycoside hydrolase family 44 protein [Myxococcaceae bacterium]|nr:glycoside hydrolase family 44 protein [Myxococcaceae bacterium]
MPTFSSRLFRTSSLALALFFASLPSRAADITIDVFAGRHPISNGIYGVTESNEAQLKRMGATMRRMGGNAWSRYNHTNSTTNEGGDGRFYKNLVLKDGGTSDYSADFVAGALDAGMWSLLEVPLLGYVAKNGSATAAPYTCGYKVSLYGPQEAVDPLDADCGNGVFLDGGRITVNDPLDTSVRIDAGFVDSWVQQLVATFGTAADGGVRFYNLGNQPALWSETHRDVHPAPSTYAETASLMTSYGKVVKQRDPAAKTLGPAEWGWLNYFDSAALERSTLLVDFVPYYLLQAKLYEQINGTRVLDYLDLHVFPQAMAPETARITAGDTSAATNALRLRSTAILWDPTYIAESWETCCYDATLRIIPRMKEWVAANYPGTGLAISEYDWGAPNHLSGALAQADVLGILGREGVDLAALGTAPADDALLEDAFKLFRNFDGAGARFGEVSVSANSSDVTKVASFAAFNAQGKLTVVLINKDSAVPQTANLNFANVMGSGSWRAFSFGAAPLARLAASGSGVVTGGTLTRVMAPYSAEIIEFSPVGGIPELPFDAGVPDAGVDAGFDGGVDAGITDAGIDAGTEDAGTPDSGSGGGSGGGGEGMGGGMMASGGGVTAGGGEGGAAGGGMNKPGGCSCHSGPGMLSLALLAFVAARRRKSAWKR